MSAAISVTTGRPYGVRRVCSAWGVARSTYYAAPIGIGPARWGPAPVVCYEELFAMIDDDLDRSPFTGEGHRPVWARLRIAGVRVSRRRVLRLMREHNLLSPRRVRAGIGASHDGTITTDAPDLMWGTSGTRASDVSTDPSRSHRMLPEACPCRAGRSISNRQQGVSFPSSATLGKETRQRGLPRRALSCLSKGGLTLESTSCGPRASLLHGSVRRLCHASLCRASGDRFERRRCRSVMDARFAVPVNG